jgi:serine/threonine protein phosphatase PrpC
VIAVRHSLAQRQSRLTRFYEAGIMGLDINGMVKVRDQERLSQQHLSVQQAAGKTIDQENPDRNSLIYAIAEAHGGKEAVPVVREMMAKRWREQFKSGWWLQDEKGVWHQKP